MSKGPLTRADRYVKKTDKIILIIGIIALLTFLFTLMLATADTQEEERATIVDDSGIDAETDINIKNQEIPNEIEFDKTEDDERPITLSPLELNMGQIILGNEATNVLTIGSNGKREIRILSVELEDAPFDGFSYDSSNCQNKELRGNLTCMVTTKWVPSVAGNVQSNFKIVWHETNISAQNAKHDEITVRGSAVTKENCNFCETDIVAAVPSSGVAIGGYRYAIGPDGKVIGAIDENGNVSDGKGNVIGRVNADGMIVDSEGNIIGVAANSKLIMDENDNVIGYVDANGVAYDIDGNAIGTMLPDGTVVDSNGKVIGKAVEAGIVVDANGQIIGKVLPDGSVVDTDGNVIGHLDKNSNVIDANGNIIGHVAKAGEVVTDADGNVIGVVMPNGDVVDADGNIIGHMNPDGTITTKQIIGKRGGQAQMVYDDAGNIIGYVDENGNVRDFNGNLIGHVDENGNIIDKNGKIIGRVSDEWHDLALDENGNVIGYIDDENLVHDNNGNLIGYVDESGSIIGNKPKVTVLGSVGDKAKLIIDENGVIIGYIDENGIAHDLNGTVIGHVDENGNVLDENRNIIGYQREVAVDANGNPIGYIDADGNVYDFDGNLIGHTDENGNIIDENGNAIGRKSDIRIALDKNGKIMGFVDEKGVVHDFDGAFLGTTDEKGQLIRRDYSGDIVGRTGEAEELVVDENGNVIGYINKDGNVRDFNGNMIGHVDENGNIVDGNGNIIGVRGDEALIAYDDAGHVIGYVDKNGLVRNDKEIIGIVDANGNIRALGRRIIGGTIDKLLLPITPAGELLGTINNRGEITDQQKVIGKIRPDGLITDMSGAKILARGVRQGYIVNWGCDYSLKLDKDGLVRREGKETGYKIYPDGTVWTPEGVFAGRTMMTGSVYDNECSYIGEASADGYVRDVNNQEIGCLNPDGTVLDLEEPKIKGHLVRRNFVLSATTWKPMGVLDESGLLRNESGEAVGCADSYGDVYDVDGVYIGRVSDAKYGYGFDEKPLGTVDQTGHIALSDGKSAYVSVNNLLVGRNNKIYGYAVPEINIVADSSGHKIGHLFPDGLVYDQIGAVVDNINSGDIGYYNGIVGKNIRPAYVVDTSGNLLGKVNYDLSVVDYKGSKIGQIDAKGYMFDKTGRLVAGVVKQGSVRGYDGAYLGYVVSTGKVIELENVKDGSKQKYRRGEVTGKVIPDGHILNSDKIVGEVLPEGVMSDVYGNPIGMTNSLGMIVGANRKEIAAMLPGGGNSSNLVLLQSGAVINSAGEVVGTAAPNGEYYDTKHIMSGKTLSDGKVISGSGKFLGEVISGDIVIGNDDTLKGIVGFDGKIYYNGTIIGKILTDALAIDTQNNIIGHVYTIGNTILSNNGEYVGRLSANGRVVSGQNNEVGYLKSNGSFIDVDKNVSGYSLPEVARNRRN